jgi:hypothetical protein
VVDVEVGATVGVVGGASGLVVDVVVVEGLARSRRLCT